jgi:hypothetical protein
VLVLGLEALKLVLGLALDFGFGFGLGCVVAADWAGDEGEGEGEGEREREGLRREIRNADFEARLLRCGFVFGVVAFGGERFEVGGGGGRGWGVDVDVLGCSPPSSGTCLPVVCPPIQVRSTDLPSASSSLTPSLATVVAGPAATEGLGGSRVSPD